MGDKNDKNDINELISKIDDNKDIDNFKKTLITLKENITTSNTGKFASYFKNENSLVLTDNSHQFNKKLINVINNIKKGDETDHKFLDILFNFKDTKLHNNINDYIINLNNIILELDVFINKYQDKLNDDTPYSKNKLISNTRKTFDSQNKLLYFIRYKYNIIFSILLVIILLGVYIKLSNKSIEIPNINMPNVNMPNVNMPNVNI